MAWSTPLTAVANSPYTAAQHNAGVRDNLLETAPAKASTGTGARIFATAGTNSIAQRVIDASSVGPGEATTSAPWVNLGTFGPQVTVTTGSYALIFLNSSLTNTGVGNRSQSSYLVSGATNISVQAGFGVYDDCDGASRDHRVSATTLQSGLTSGSNVFTQQYGVTAGTGTFGNRTLAVMAL